MSDRNELYADSFLSLIAAEGNGNEVLDELFRVSRTIDGNDQLRDALSDPRIEAARRVQIVQDILGGSALPLTVSLVSTVVTNGRVRELSTIVDLLVSRSAAGGDRTIAKVRSAVPLTDEQKTRLAEALSKTTGQPVEILVEVDPSVLGGLVTTIGDTVIDGSVRHRLSQLRESF